MKKILLLLFLFLFFCSIAFSEDSKEIICQQDKDNSSKYNGFFPLDDKDASKRKSSHCFILLKHGAKLKVQVEEAYYKEREDFEIDISVYLQPPNSTELKKLDCGVMDKTIDLSSDPWTLGFLREKLGFGSGFFGVGDDFPYNGSCNSEITPWWKTEKNLLDLYVDYPQRNKGIPITITLTDFFLEKYFTYEMGIVIDEEIDSRTEAHSFFIPEDEILKAPHEVMTLDSTFGLKLVLVSSKQIPAKDKTIKVYQLDFRVEDAEGNILCNEITAMSNGEINLGNEKCASQGIDFVVVKGIASNPVRDKETKEKRYYFSVEYKIKDPELINVLEEPKKEEPEENGEKEFGVCPEGKITQQCYCGIDLYDSGYCCQAFYSTTECGKELEWDPSEQQQQLNDLIQKKYNEIMGVK